MSQAHFVRQGREFEEDKLRTSEPNLDDSDDEDVNQGTDRLGDSLDLEDTDSAMDDSQDEGEIDNCDIDNAIAEEEEEEERDDTKASLFITNGIKRRIEKGLNNFPPRWKNWLIRGFSGICLVSGFSLLVFIGPSGLLFLTYLVVTSSYSEVMKLGLRVTKPDNQNLPRLIWSLYFVVQYTLVGSYVWDLICDISPYMSPFLKVLAEKHVFISFSLYLGILMWFVLSLGTNYIRSYALFSWSHMLLFYLCIPGFMMNKTMFEAMIWYVLPMTLITLNDIAAYYVGFFFGKTPLIKLSPKKTWEGFIGGGLITVTLGTFISYLMMTPYLTCPVKINPDFLVSEGPKSLLEVDYETGPHPTFLKQPFQLFGQTIQIYPFLLHAFVISILCSSVGPFGGFLASGFKRGCKRKNFGGFIPGHGGVTDRCDCMFLCAAIIHVYYYSFIS